MTKINAPSNAGQGQLPFMPQAPQAPQQQYAQPQAPPPQAQAFTPNTPYQDQTTGQWMMNGSPLGPPQQAQPVQQYQPQPQPIAPPQPAPAPVNGFANGFGGPTAPPPAMAGGLGAAINAVAGGSGMGGLMGSGPLNQFDFGGIEERDFSLLPVRDANNQPIQYEGRVSKAAIGTSGEGNSKIDVVIVVTYPASAVGVTISDNLTFTATSAWKAKSMCRACGCLSEDGKRFIGQSEQDLVDSIVSFQVVHSEWPVGSGQLRNKIAGSYKEGTMTPGLPTAPAASLAINVGNMGLQPVPQAPQPQAPMQAQQPLPAQPQIQYQPQPLPPYQSQQPQQSQPLPPGYQPNFGPAPTG